MTKKEQFLWIVQTTILANNIRLATEPDTIAEKNSRKRNDLVADFSVALTFGLCRDAMDDSERIPANLSAVDAARDWFFWKLESVRDDDAKLPAWFARG